MAARHRKFRLPVLSRLTLAWSTFSLCTLGLVAFALFGGDLRPPQVALAVEESVDLIAPPLATESETKIALKSVIDESEVQPAIGVTLAAAPTLRDRVEGEEPFSIETEDAMVLETPSSIESYSGGRDQAIAEDVVIMIDGAPAQSASSRDGTRRSAGPITLASIDQSLSRKTEFGSVPKISADGRKALERYARPFKPAERGNIGLIVGGLGLNKTVTERAIDELPPEVTLAFAPYAKNLKQWAERARDAGHEILLELPMEHRTGDQSALGPAALLTERSTQENLQRLDWLMSRFDGYFGVTNYLGSRFSGSGKSITPVLAKVQSAGLAYIDDTGGVRQFSELESRGGTTVNRIIETGYSDSQETARDLKALESIALNNGDSLGKTYASSETIDEIIAWTAELRTKELTLAPASGILALRRNDS